MIVGLRLRLTAVFDALRVFKRWGWRMERGVATLEARGAHL